MESQHVMQLETVFRQAGDEQNADKMHQLTEKLNIKTFIIAFCGHFSAGKSSMINRFIGKEVLPSSPIPTSANVVTIEQGPDQARIWRKDGSCFNVPTADLESLQKYAVNGEEIQEIRIHCPTDFLPDHVQIMDTPGIDSTDDAHKIATESALHLADLVLYVMDYNHVQSEVNFEFTKTLKDRGKAVWLVVNQIDKHNEFELHFSEYQKSVRNSFAAWGIEPDGIFYTSMREMEMPGNQFEKLRTAIQDLLPRKDLLLEQSVADSAKYLIDEHMRLFSEKQAPERDRYLNVLEGDTTTEEAESEVAPQEHLLQGDSSTRFQRRIDRLQSEIGGFESAAMMLKAEMEKDIFSLIGNAILIPFQTTELCGKFLESRRPGFRVGFLFTGGKTEQEKEARLQELHADFTGKIQANLDWHLRDLLVKIPERHGIRNEEYAKSVYDLSVTITPDMLVGWIKEGALSSQEYMYQYAKDIASEVKTMYRRIAVDYIDQAVKLALASNSDTISQLKVKLEEQQNLLQAAKGLEQLESEEAKYQADLLHVVGDSDWRRDSELYQAVHVEEADPYQRDVKEEQLMQAAITSPDASQNTDRESLLAENETNRTYKTALLQAAEKLRTASQEIVSIPGLQTIAKHMTDRALRLEQNLFTVALFGAFSAGKSSFANAMMGSLVLPVSPNPTTATINKILPPTAEWSHGNVRVRVKTAHDIMTDIKGSIQVLEQDVNWGSVTEEDEIDSFFKTALQAIAGMDPENIPPNAKPHYSFLKAVKKGLSEMRGFFGNELRVDMETFREYVAREEKACFVEWIELYYDCPLTRQGIVVIDTPGADSINARHTKVAFDYIKNADAVLFVTYYNHAFSNADREFLIQLGRVKDSFEMDKMFFLVNAADLASNEEELTGVLSHVKKNLTACGISMPRIYPVSSQMALLARLAEKGALPVSADRVYRKLTGTAEAEPIPNPAAALDQSGIASFERDFLSFTIEELTEVAVQSAMAEIRRGISTLTELLETSKKGEAERADKRLQLQESLRNALEHVQNVETESELRALEKEIDELVYYVKQRVFLRYFDAFNESFSSSVLRDDAGNTKKLLLKSLHELLRFLAFDVSQEMRATAVRVEKQVNRGAARIFVKLAEAVDRYLLGCTVEAYQRITLPTPDFPDELPGTEDGRFAAALSLYKNAKDFFERDAKSKMRDEIQNLLQAPISDYLEENGEKLKAFYQESFLQIVEQMKQDTALEMNEYAEGIEAVLTMQIDIGELEATKQKLGRLL